VTDQNPAVTATFAAINHSHDDAVHLL